MKHFCKKTLSMFLSLVMVFSVFTVIGVPLSLTSAAADDTTANLLANPLQGGLEVYFTNSSSAMQTNIDSIDPTASATTYIFRVQNHYTDRKITITNINNISYLTNGTSLLNTAFGKGFCTRYIDTTAFSSAADGTVLDFTVTYTIEGVYDSTGTALQVFTQPAYIGVWNPNDDSKAIMDVNNGQYGFTVRSGSSYKVDITNRFMVDHGILESSSLTGDGSQNISFVYNLWVDTTDLASKNWQDIGLRMFAQKWADTRNHFQNSNFTSQSGTFTLGGSFGNASTVSLSIADLTTSWSSTATYSGPSDTSYWAYGTGNAAKRMWAPQTSLSGGTLYNANESCYFPFVGVMFTGSTTSASPATITFNKMCWNSYSNYNQGYFSGTINCYIFDKATLRDYVRAMANMDDFAPMSARYTSTAWTNYTNALKTAMTVLANQKTTQYAVTQAYNNLVSAVNALNSTSTLSTDVLSVNHIRYSGDMSSAEAETVQRYILAPAGSSYTVPYYTGYTATNKRSDAITKTYTANTAINTETYSYWVIDTSAIDAALTAANEILNADWCYSNAYKTSLQSLCSTLETYKEDNTSTPTLQSSVDNLIADLNALLATKDDESNHTHVAGDWVVTRESTCVVNGLQEQRCQYCGTLMATETLPLAEHTYGDYTSNENGTHSRTCEVCGNVLTEDCSYTTVTVDPTCDESGYDSHICVYCAYEYRDNFTDPTDHDWVLNEELSKPSTCEEAGYDYYVCANNPDHTKMEELPLADHTWNEGTVTTEPDCTTAGEMTYTCIVCGETKTETIPALGHDYETAVTDPTCTEQGYTTYTCSRCGDTYRDDYVPATGHSWGEGVVTKAPDCSTGEAGIMTYTCLNDPSHTKTEEIPAEHTWGNETVLVEPTCTEEGLKSAVCEVCGVHQEDIVIPALGHDIVIDVEAKDATCTESGYTEGHHCSRCDEETVISTEIPALGHDPYVSKIAQDPTCTAIGWTEEIRCRHTGEILQESETIPATGHDYNPVVTDPTCTADGYTTYTCLNCGDSYKADIVPALGHNWGDPIETKDATCTEDGYEIYECSRCHITKKEVINATGHTWNQGNILKTPTCTETGLIEYTCLVCGYVKQVVLAKSEHVYTSVVTPPTCTTDGYTTYTCIRCGYSYIGDVVTAPGHTYNITVVSPSCTQDGYTKYECIVCGYSYTDNVVAAPGHTFVDSVIEPTCTEQGYTLHTCIVCGYSYKDTYTDALGHDYVDVTVSPTCTEQGYTAHTCTRCGISYKDEYVPALGHNFVETDRVSATNTKSGYILYTCDRCGFGYQEMIYVGGKALVCETLYDYQHKPVKLAQIVVTNVDTGESFDMMTDLNGYFTYVFPQGNYEVFIHKDLYEDSIGYIYVADGVAEVDLPVLQPASCDCLCHQTNIWGKIFRILIKILKIFRSDIQCCPDTTL